MVNQLSFRLFVLSLLLIIQTDINAQTTKVLRPTKEQGPWECVYYLLNNNDVNILDRPSLDGADGFRAPLHGGLLKKLPIGEVQPKGWLREVLVRQGNGLCGQLGSVSAWLDKNNNQWLSDKGDHGWEEVPYWLRG